MNSSICTIPAKALYLTIYDKTDNLFKNNSRRLLGEHFVGTPGLGKTFKFLQIAYLHDIRVKHIIQEGIPKDKNGGSLSLFQ